MTNRFRIEQFTVTPEQSRFDAFRSRFSCSSRGRFVPPGTYERLMRGPICVMSNTPNEIRDLSPFLRRVKAMAGGHVLINGLGLAIAAAAVLTNPTVESITVIEIERDVINLVAPRIDDHRVNIIEHDAMTFMPPKGRYWSVVWHDIWDNICSDNLDQMKVLHRRYCRRAAWQGSWCRAECERQWRGA